MGRQGSMGGMQPQPAPTTSGSAASGILVYFLPSPSPFHPHSHRLKRLPYHHQLLCYNMKTPPSTPFPAPLPLLCNSLILIDLPCSLFASIDSGYGETG
ncbi:hypothetical protein MGYG_06044 [Nannizzia gypsea CBS 118893]|uniref:Uncharacterized protein n=1 Tax=Arthroderma gypseum (strain ATCC MYA-4604 / CBS 118893) TaxID=535722 RepID=E4V0A8_ARTGP|nr:hypothetical protein MGYG_06044 [Nannizzia gypsea CBS 118893]EFR03045.1 hypothetical protein MGYG_06044 [Nannizzia gypsea CBS 118893]